LAVRPCGAPNAWSKKINAVPSNLTQSSDQNMSDGGLVALFEFFGNLFKQIPFFSRGLVAVANKPDATGRLGDLRAIRNQIVLAGFPLFRR
jgi:hypothetical protein